MALKLIGEVALDGSGFERGLDKMRESVKGFIVGAFGLYGIEEIIRKTVDTAKELVTESKRLGIGVEQLQVLKQAAKDNSTELGTLAKAFEKLDVAREKALSGSAEGMKLMGRFAQLGISQEDLKSRTAADLFRGPIRDKANSMSQEDLGPILKEVLGKGFGELLPVLKTDFEELEKKMRGLGTLIDTETAAKLTILSNEFELLGAIIATRLGPVLLNLAEIFYKLGAGLAATNAWLKSLILGGSKDMHAVMNATPGFGGQTRDQKEQFEKWKAQKALTGADDAKKAADDAKAEGLKTFKEWMDWLQDLKKRFADLAEQLQHPAKPTFDVPESDEKQQKTPKAHRERGDSLIRVGNFLGSSKDALESIAEKQVQLLQRIAENTQRRSYQGDVNTSDSDFQIV